MVKVVFLAGGSGERFWPLSRKGKPKQFLKLLGENSLLRDSYLRIQGFVPDDSIFLVTYWEHKVLAKKELPEIPEENIIGEPMGRNTAPAIILPSFLLEEEDVMVVLPSDHYIPEKEKFREHLLKAIGLAQDGYLVTFGIQPTRAETGYGYIEVEEEIPGGFKVKRFREKPSLEVAEEFLSSGRHFWNSGMFIWKVGVFREAARKFLPKTYDALEKASECYRDLAALSQAYEKIESISVDYAIMEKAENVAMVKGDFLWSDVGSWLSLAELLGKGNSYAENSHLVTSSEAEKYLVLGNSKEVAILGLENLGYIETEDAILILDLEKAQEVRKIVARLREAGKEHLL
ncbi:MAG: sugar phosphate nucleotidyltransferase [Caldiserica bacterium]|jgi:mannose-1-phosphate guanylyltransferase|nr:sugar phosphate nucleotidyltransferase [Caldisericota bacterium]MDH7562174.1 mannose-1-phosphate guanylyltransferase [Caldisericota bacterium]